MKQKRMKKWGILFLLGLSCAAGGRSITIQAASVEHAEASETEKTDSGWVKKDGVLYYYSPQTGELLKDQWITEEGRRYYLTKDGAAATGWESIDDKTYYFNSDGSLCTGWREIQQNLYYFDEEGSRCQGFTSVGEDRYYMDQNGIVQMGWLIFRHESYYADPETGILAAGWKEFSNGNIYYFEPSSGKMLTDWQEIEGNTYYFRANGILVKKEWIEGKYLGSDGAYIPNYIDGTDMQWPLDTKWRTISSDFGSRNSPGGIGSTNHHGIDITADAGEKIYAAEAGVIRVHQYSGSAGNYIEIEHNNGLITQYMHMSKFEEGLDVDSPVEKGQVIGYVGSTGNSTGNHLHFGVKYKEEYQYPLYYVEIPE